MLKVASWNVNSLRVRLLQVLDWLEREEVDILGLQETKLQDPDFPEQAFLELGYRAIYAGQPTYNGVALVSRKPAENEDRELPNLNDPQRRMLAATIGDLRVINVYVPNGQSVGSEKYAYKLHWLECLRAYLAEQLIRHEQLLLMGDFNIAPDDRDVHDPEAWHGRILCSEAERATLRSLFDLGLQDTLRLFEQPPATFSWWDYRAAAFRRNRGLRIDLLLAGPTLAEQCRSSTVDKTPRTLERPSDHAPVVAHFA